MDTPVRRSELPSLGRQRNHTPTPKMLTRKKALFHRQENTIQEKCVASPSSSDESSAGLGKLTLLSDDDENQVPSETVTTIINSRSFFSPRALSAVTIDTSFEDEIEILGDEAIHISQTMSDKTDKENISSNIVPTTNEQMQMEQMKTPSSFTIPTSIFYSKSANVEPTSFFQNWRKTCTSKVVPQKRRVHRKKRSSSDVRLGRVSHGIRKPRKSLNFQMSTVKKIKNEVVIKREVDDPVQSPVKLSVMNGCITDPEVSTESDFSDTESLPETTTSFANFSATEPAANNQSARKFFKTRSTQKANYWITDTISATVKRGRGLEMVEPETPKVKRRKVDTERKTIFSNIQNKVDSIIQCLDDKPKDPVVPDQAIEQKDAAQDRNIMISPTAQLRNLTSGLVLDSPKEKYFSLFKRRKVQATTFAAALKTSSVRQMASKWRPQSASQMQIDAGQKEFGARQCPQCSLVYTVHEPEEERIHEAYHNASSTFRFNGWTEERVLFNVDIWGVGGRIIVVNSQDSLPKQKRIQELMEFVDKDLGGGTTSFSEKTQCFVAIARKVVLGMCVAEPLKSAHKLTYVNGQDCRTLETYPVRCGISKIWVSPSHRRSGVGRQLFLAVRNHFFFGYQMRCDEIAFSSPTPAGRDFACRMTGLKEFFVYV